MQIDTRLTPQAHTAWRWRLLYLRAQIDATLVANGQQMWGPVLCKAFDELRTIQHVENSTSCGVPHVPCTKPPPGPPPPPRPQPRPADVKCPAKPFAGKTVPWVRAVNASNVYGQVVEGRPTPGVPLLGLFATEAGCKSACEALSNCTQYNWVSAQQLLFLCSFPLHFNGAECLFSLPFVR